MTPERLAHVLGVEGLILHIAQREGLDLRAAGLAALLHDVAKPEAREEQRRLMLANRRYSPSAEDLDHPEMWHGLAAATVAEAEYGVDDEEILEAVSWHTTGRTDLRRLGLALYVADYLEPTRNYAGVSADRARLLQLPLIEAAATVAANKVARVKEKNRKPHSQTEAMCNWLAATSPSKTQSLAQEVD